jgi:catechol 2,3-dioxygenase-like lactoylglutathione lyase family enzyme
MSVVAGRVGGMTRDVQITFDCADPARLAAFWAEVLGYRLQPPPEGFDSWDAALETWGVPPDQWNSRSALLPVEGDHPRVFFQRVPEGKTAKNRVHVRAAPGLDGDERMAALEAEAVRLEGLGATRAYRVEPDKATMENGFITMHDPEGNEFCLD